jgi:O-acetyl-ADP-ribose deacetylase (regulator of RNase III)
MTNPIKIFLCHKKKLEREEDGHRVKERNATAEILHAILQSYTEKFNVWMDASHIATGMAWETEIYKTLLLSDVLLVAIGPGTSKSEWVRREIALATAVGISVLPLGYDLTQEEFGQELKDLHIDRIQGRLTSNIRFPAKEALIKELESDLQLARERTILNQSKVLSDMASNRTIRRLKTQDRQRAFSIDTSFGKSTITLNVASGDLTKVRGIEILVNSENDYMQMARFFETRTVSSLLRRRGSRISGGKYVDTVQQELDIQLGDRARPVQAAEVFITSAGGPDSKLATENRARYIFHVAAVQAIDAEARVVPFRQPHQIEDCVTSCLAKLLELNRLQGVISPPNSMQRALQESLASNGNGTSKSIIFPLFGTGQGGGSTQEVIGPMLVGLQRFFDDPHNQPLADDLDDIYFAAFTESDVEEVAMALKTQFG